MMKSLFYFLLLLVGVAQARKAVVFDPQNWKNQSTSLEELSNQKGITPELKRNLMGLALELEEIVLLHDKCGSISINEIIPSDCDADLNQKVQLFQEGYEALTQEIFISKSSQVQNLRGRQKDLKACAELLTMVLVPSFATYNRQQFSMNLEKDVTLNNKTNLSIVVSEDKKFSKNNYIKISTQVNIWTQTCWEKIQLKGETEINPVFITKLNKFLVNTDFVGVLNSRGSLEIRERSAPIRKVVLLQDGNDYYYSANEVLGQFYLNGQFAQKSDLFRGDFKQNLSLRVWRSPQGSPKYYLGDNEQLYSSYQKITKQVNRNNYRIQMEVVPGYTTKTFMETFRRYNKSKELNDFYAQKESSSSSLAKKSYSTLDYPDFENAKLKLESEDENFYDSSSLNKSNYSKPSKSGSWDLRLKLSSSVNFLESSDSTNHTRYRLYNTGLNLSLLKSSSNGGYWALGGGLSSVSLYQVDSKAQNKEVPTLSSMWQPSAMAELGLISANGRAGLGIRAEMTAITKQGYHGQGLLFINKGSFELFVGAGHLQGIDHGQMGYVLGISLSAWAVH